MTKKRMTVDEFMEILGTIKGFYCLASFGAVRKPSSAKSRFAHCPISAVAEKVHGRRNRAAGDYVEVAQALGLHPRTAQSLAYAADTPFGTPLQRQYRKRMLEVLGLKN